MYDNGPGRPGRLALPSLVQWLNRNRQAMVDDLAEYVGHETPSTSNAALASGLSWVQRWMEQRLGPPAETRTIEGGEHGDVWVADYTGNTDRRVTALCHYDTVWPLGTIEEWPFCVEGDRVTGPGVFDMKAGLVQAVWALRALDSHGLDRPHVRFVLNGDEEIGSPASRPVIEESCQDADVILVFEPSANGAVKTSRKGTGLYQVHLRGKEAHAGLDPDAGASAIEELAHTILNLRRLCDTGSGVSVNIGLVQGGTRANVIAAEATAEVDLRAQTADEARRLEGAMAELQPENPQVVLTTNGGWNRPVMERTAGIQRVYRLAREIALAIDMDLREVSVGGASDANFVAAQGIPLLDGIGAVGGGAHARHEHISVTGMVERGGLAACLLHSVAIEELQLTGG